MMRAISDAAAKRDARLDHDQSERPIDAGQAGDGCRRAGESTADHAHPKCLPYLRPLQLQLDSFV